MTDQELHAGLLADDRATLKQIYDRYFGQIARHVQANGGGEADALDVFQDSVVALYVNARSGKYTVREDSQLGTYLHGIARNVWRAKQRKASKLATVSLLDGQGEAAPSEDEELLQRVDQLDAAFATLGGKCRRLLRLFYYEKLSLKRIAELMTFTEKTAKNNKYRCMQELRKTLNRAHD